MRYITPQKKLRKVLSIDMQSLERRRMLAAQMDGEVLRVSGTDGPDTIIVNFGGDGATVELNGQSQTLPDVQPKAIEVDAGGGDDHVEVYSFGAEVSVHGGAGNDDILIYAPGQIGHYFGDAGDDVFHVYRSSFTERDFHGGEGFDTVDYSGFGNQFWPVTVTLDDVANDGSPTEIADQPGPDNVHSDVEKIVGTIGADTIDGSASNANLVLIGNGGGDKLSGGNGNDRIIAGDTNIPGDVAGATIRGGAGDDTIYGSSHDDVIYGDAGNDRIFGGAGNDWIDGGDGNDTIYGQDGNDRLIGGSGNDFIDGGGGTNTIRGQGGRDYIVANRLVDDLRGNRGDLVRPALARRR